MRRWIAGALALFAFVAVAAALAWCSRPEPRRGTVAVTVVSSERGAEELEREIVIPIEEALASLEGVELRSISREGVATVEIAYAPAPDLALTDEIRDRINALELPDDIEPPSISRADLGRARRWLVIAGDPQATTANANDLRARFENFEGIGAVPICGELERESSVVLDPSLLTARDMRVTDVMRALERSVFDLPAGRIENGGRELNIRATAGDSDLAELLVGHGFGSPVRLAELGTIRDGFADPECLAWSGERTIALRVHLQSGVGDWALERVDAFATEAGVTFFGGGARIETGRVHTAPGTSREQRWRLAEQLGPELRALAGVRDVLLLVEADSTAVVLARETENPTADELRALLQLVASHPGTLYLPDGAATVRVFGPEGDQRWRIADDLVARLRRDPEILGAVRIDEYETGLGAQLDRAKMAELHADPREVSETLAAATDGGLSITTFGPREERRIVVRVDAGRHLAGAADLRVDGRYGRVRLGDFVTFGYHTTSRLLRCGGQRCIELQAFGDPSEDIEDTIEQIETLAQSTELPPGYTVRVVAP